MYNDSVYLDLVETIIRFQDGRIHREDLEDATISVKAWHREALYRTIQSCLKQVDELQKLEKSKGALKLMGELTKEDYINLIRTEVNEKKGL